MNHADYLNLAAAEAMRGIKKNEGGPFGAVIIRAGKVIAQAHNTVLKHSDPTNHAEVNAIRLATRKLKSPFLIDCVIYSTTEPCPMCFSAIHWAQIPSLIYSTTISDVAKLGFNELSISAAHLRRKGHLKMNLLRKPNKSCQKLLSFWKNNTSRHTY